MGHALTENLANYSKTDISADSWVRCSSCSTMQPSDVNEHRLPVSMFWPLFNAIPLYPARDNSGTRTQDKTKTSVGNKLYANHNLFDQPKMATELLLEYK